MKILFYSSILTVIISFCSCALLEPKDEILGRWEWECSWGGFNGDKITPESKGNTISIIFNKDNSYQEYNNGNLIETLHYEIPIEKKNRFGYLIIKINNVSYRAKVEQDFLLISPGVSDGFVAFYRKSDSKLPKRTPEEYLKYFLNSEENHN